MLHCKFYNMERHCAKQQEEAKVKDEKVDHLDWKAQCTVDVAQLKAQQFSIETSLLEIKKEKLMADLKRTCEIGQFGIRSLSWGDLHLQGEP